MDDEIEEILTRGIVNIIPDKKTLAEALKTRKLNIYLGIDPTATRIHLGHAVSLRLLQKLASLGHNVTFLIGDFTALVGDTSDKESERPVLTPDEIEKNFATYKEQASKILNFEQIKVVKNSEWLSKLKFDELLQLVQRFSLNDFVSRELIKKRLTEGKHIRLDEVLYPIMQGYDSYHLDTDLQIGAADQTFNMQAGRTLQEKLRNKNSFVMSTEYLMGTDGRKMSKSWGNAIWLDDAATDMYAKVMAVNDDLIVQYFTLATSVPEEEIKDIEQRLKSENPIGIKKQLAYLIVSEIHTEAEARKAAEHFEKTVQKHEMPEEIPTASMDPDTHMTISHLLVHLNLAPSMSEAKRLVEQGAILVNEELIEQPNLEIIPEDNMIIKAGKRNYVRIRVN